MKWPQLHKHIKYKSTLTNFNVNPQVFSRKGHWTFEDVTNHLKASNSNDMNSQESQLKFIITMQLDLSWYKSPHYTHI